MEALPIGARSLAVAGRVRRAIPSMAPALKKSNPAENFPTKSPVWIWEIFRYPILTGQTKREFEFGELAKGFGGRTCDMRHIPNSTPLLRHS
jgi:hypothetical protein